MDSVRADAGAGRLDGLVGDAGAASGTGFTRVMRRAALQHAPPSRAVVGMNGGAVGRRERDPGGPPAPRAFAKDAAAAAAEGAEPRPLRAAGPDHIIVDVPELTAFADLSNASEVPCAADVILVSDWRLSERQDLLAPPAGLARAPRVSHVDGLRSSATSTRGATEELGMPRRPSSTKMVPLLVPPARATLIGLRAAGDAMAMFHAADVTVRMGVAVRIAAGQRGGAAVADPISGLGKQRTLDQVPPPSARPGAPLAPNAPTMGASDMPSLLASMVAPTRAVIRRATWSSSPSRSSR